MSENKVKCAILRITLISEKRELEWVRVLSVCNMELNVWTYRFPQAAPYCPINHAHYSDVKLNMLIVTLLRKMKVFLWRRRAWFEAQGVCGVWVACVFLCVGVICRFVCQGQNGQMCPLPSLSSTPHTWIRADTKKNPHSLQHTRTHTHTISPSLSPTHSYTHEGCISHCKQTVYDKFFYVSINDFV